MARVFFFLSVMCVVFMFSPNARAESVDLYVIKNGASLHAKPDDSSQVLQKAREGWILHAESVVTGTDNAQWYRIWEIDSEIDGEINYWYVHHAYATDAVYVRASDVRPNVPDKSPSNKNDDQFFLQIETPSGTNKLGKAGLGSILACLQAIPINRQWLKDIFYYNDGTECFNLLGPGKSDFDDFQSVERTMGIDIDVRPTTASEKHAENSAPFSHIYYNPKAAQWVAENFTNLKATSPEIFRQAQTVYARNRSIARSFVYAYEHLTLHDDYEHQVQTYKEAVANGENMLPWLQRFSPVPEKKDEILLHDFDGESWVGYLDGYNRFRFAIGFWLRRGIDGSAHSFKTLMDTVMQEYDASWYAQFSLPIPAISATAVSSGNAPAQPAKETLDDQFFLPMETPSGTNRLGKAGLDSILTCLQALPANRQWLKDFFYYSNGVECFNLLGPDRGSFSDVRSVERTIGISLDVRPMSPSGEHIGKSGPFSYIHFNPMVTRWVAENFTNLRSTNPELFSQTQAAYNKNQNIARSFVHAYEYLTRYDNYDKQIQEYKKAAVRGDDMLTWLERFKPSPKQKYDVYFDDFDGNGEIGYPDGYNRFRFAVGFWLRRGIDGSAHSFKTLMDTLMKEYDAAWYAEFSL